MSWIARIVDTTTGRKRGKETNAEVDSTEQEQRVIDWLHDDVLRGASYRQCVLADIITRKMGMWWDCVHYEYLTETHDVIVRMLPRYHCWPVVEIRVSESCEITTRYHDYYEYVAQEAIDKAREAYEDISLSEYM